MKAFFRGFSPVAGSMQKPPSRIFAKKSFFRFFEIQKTETMIRRLLPARSPPYCRLQGGFRIARLRSSITAKYMIVYAPGAGIFHAINTICRICRIVDHAQIRYRDGACHVLLHVYCRKLYGIFHATNTICRIYRLKFPAPSSSL
jgi:hypothetical protein